MGENDDNDRTTRDNDHNNDHNDDHNDDGEDSQDGPTQHPPPLLQATARGGEGGCKRQ